MFAVPANLVFAASAGNGREFQVTALVGTLPPPKWLSPNLAVSTSFRFSDDGDSARNLTVQRDPAPQHKNKDERQHCSHDDPPVASANSIRSSLRNRPPRNVMPQPQQPRVSPSRPRQRRLPHELNAQRIQEPSRASQQRRRKVGN